MKINEILVEDISTIPTLQTTSAPDSNQDDPVDVVFFGKLGRDINMREAVDALEEVLPAEYPKGPGSNFEQLTPAQWGPAPRRIIQLQQSPSVVVTNKPLSVAKKLVATFQAYGIPCKIVGQNIEEKKQHLEETYEGDEFYEAYGDLWYNEDEQLDEAEYHGRKVPLGKPMRGDVKKFKVYVKDPSTGNVKKVNFGDPNMRIKKSNPARRKSFRARHNCANPGPRTKARYWSCRKW